MILGQKYCKIKSGDLMKYNSAITKIYSVYEGEFRSGNIQRRIGRPCDCFVYYLYGSAEYVFENHSFRSDSNNFIYLAKGSVYKINVLENSKYICINFDFADNTIKNSLSFNNTGFTIKNSFSKALNIWNKKSPWHMPEIFSIIYSLYCEALKSEYSEYTATNEIFSKLCDFILKNYSDTDFSVPQISDYFDISEVHLRRIFKNTVGTSPIKYINCLKLEKAKNILKTSNLTISETALSSGFSDPYYFSKVFKKEFDITPSEYRKKFSSV